MISNSASSYRHITLEQINTASISLIHEEVNNNDEELEKIKQLVEESVKNGHKIPLLALVFLLFYNSGKTTLKKSEAYELMEKETYKYKNKIISSPTERYCMINHKNFKSKIKDILKKKKWFSRKVNDDGEIEYTLNPSVVISVAPKINSYVKVLIKNEFLFKTENEEKQEEEKCDSNDSKEKKIKKNKDDDEDYTDNTEEVKGRKKRKKLVKKKDLKGKKKKNNRKKKNGGNTDISSDEKVDNISSNESYDCSKTLPLNNKEEDNKEEEENETDCKSQILNSDPQLLNKKRKYQKNLLSKMNKVEKMKNYPKKYLRSSSLLDANKNEKEANLDTEDASATKSIQIKKDSQEDKKIENKNELECLYDKINSIITLGDAFMKLLKNKKFSELSSKKLDSSRKIIEAKENEIKAQVQIMEKIIQREEKVKSTNAREVEKKLKEIKMNFNEYKTTTELLINIKKKYENSENKAEEKEAINVYKENYSKCAELSEKIKSAFSNIFNDYVNIGELLNILYAEEKGENFFNMKTIADNEYYRNTFKKVMDSIKIDVNEIHNESTNINSIKEDAKSEFNESNAESPLAAGAINNSESDDVNLFLRSPNNSETNRNE